jgi:hypothetical protein
VIEWELFSPRRSGALKLPIQKKYRCQSVFSGFLAPPMRWNSSFIFHRNFPLQTKFFSAFTSGSTIATAHPQEDAFAHFLP